MTKAIRWRIIVLQVVALLVLVFGSGIAFFASNFTSDQIHAQLAPQQIFFPKDAASGLPANLSQYAGQQVLTGDQAHAYAEHFIGLHLKEIGQGHPYSYWSGLALRETDPAVKAKDQGIADTLFKGETLKSMLNTAWTFSVIGQIAFYGALGLLIAALIVLAALAFEVVEVVRGKETVEVITTRAGPALASATASAN
ncbi:MAG TPA: hypothetical protein VGP82_05415 [Ktedonobacterales bacterium]|jgi:hypothetical protein|nr:hypothetical protein [Ktedonobacterales bacterium]